MYCLKKKGVSLITVLIFMMVATIAATATYKWLSSTGFTSAERMAMSEAREAAHAGLESARSWMTYHANDVGGIVRQYYDGKKKPVALTSVVRGMNGGKQLFSVWLTGVDADGSAFKFTVVSTGTSRGNAKYSETAVFNVRGLYKVQVPQIVVHKHVDNPYAYVGSSVHSTEGFTTSSALINGNWSGNPFIIQDELVITGNMELSGNNISAGKRACIAGDLKYQNEALTGGDLYVMGNATNLMLNLGGNAVFEKNLFMANTGYKFVVGGDLTVNGKFTPDDTKDAEIKGNFCMGPSAEFYVAKLQHDFVAKGHVKFEKSSPFGGSGPNHDGGLSQEFSAKHLTLGGQGKSVYIKGAQKCVNYNGCTNMPKQSPTTYVQDYNMFKTFGNVVSSSTSSMQCNTSIVDYCKSILGTKQKGCNGTNYQIEDGITTAYDAFKDYDKKTTCLNGKNVDNFNVSALNTCWKKAAPENLYHGYLVVNLGSKNVFNNPSGTLDGNFIFYAANKLGNINFPETTARSNVFVYLGNGASQVIGEGAGTHRYYVYSKGDIGMFMLNSNTKKIDGRNVRVWDGTFFMAGKNCAKIQNTNSDNIFIRFDESLQQDLVDNYIICGKNEIGCGNVPEDDKDPTIVTDGEELVNGFDNYYISNAPQLSVTLESQYRNKEVQYDNLTSGSYTTIKPSYVLLPRIIYLTKDSPGRLSDYLSIVNLNGGKMNLTAGQMNCTPSFPMTEVLTHNGKLSPGNYQCSFTPNDKKNYKKMPFWISVDGENGEATRVKFEVASERLFAGDASTSGVTVSLVTEGKKPIEVDVTVEDPPDANWKISPENPVVKISSSNGLTTYRVALEGNSTTPIFKVTANNSATNGTVFFRLKSCNENGTIVQPSYESVNLMGEAFVNRSDIPSTGFCDNKKHKTIDGELCEDIVKRPDCAGSLLHSAAGEWVRPNCSEINTNEKNKRWRCGLVNGDPVRLEKDVISPFCEVFVHDSSVATLHDQGVYNFFASYKAKVFKLNLLLEGVNDNSKVKVHYTTDASGTVATSVCDSKNSCEIPMFAGDSVFLEYEENGNDEFSQWQFIKSASTGEVYSASSDQTLKILAVRDTLVHAVFNKNKNHCFYTDFKDTESGWCSATSSRECIDKCTSTGKKNSCSVKGDGLRPESHWLVPRTNSGHNYAEISRDADAIYYSGSGNGNSSNATVTYLLNRAEAGGHGLLMSRFKSCAMQGNKKNSLMNSGFILRSSDNAGEYSILSIYGIQESGNFSVVARMCEGDGTGINNVSKAHCSAEKPFGIRLTSSEFANTAFNVNVDVRGDNAVIELSYKNGSSWVRSTVSLPLTIPASYGQFVGLSLAEDCFKVYNLGWESNDWYGQDCFDIPKVTCSFATNYLGGILPLNEETTPWVGLSKWFNDPTDPTKMHDGCTLSYHYNGCDLDDNLLTNRCDPWLDGTTHCSSCNFNTDDGPYYVTGKSANTLKNSTYTFGVAGLHGMSKTYNYNGSAVYGSVREASVTVDCSGSGGNGHLYTASCGRFMVGDITECAQDVSFSTDACVNQTSCMVSVSGGIANLRSSTMSGDVSGLPEDPNSGIAPTISMIMKDANGRLSQEFQINGNGRFNRDVNLMADMQEFDPEKVVSIEFSSAHAFTLSGLTSSCPNTVGVLGCSAQIEGDRFVVHSTITNASAAVCKVDGSEKYGTAEKDCPSDGVFYIPAVDVYKNLNNSGDLQRSYTFTVTTTAKDNKSQKTTCTTDPVVLSRNEFTCSVSTHGELVAGDEMPAINYSITNCPLGGCSVIATVGGEAPVTLNYRDDGLVASWMPNINTKAGTYQYILEYGGLTCEASVTFKDGQDGEATNCAIDFSDSTFTADLSLPSGGNSSVKLWYTDYLGNVIGQAKSTSSSTTSFREHLPAITVSGQYVLVLSINGKEACSVNYEYTAPAEIKADCYIENGRFKTKNKNTGETIYSVSLNRNDNGTPYGNTVSTGSWSADGFVDLDAYVPTTPGTYTYNLWGSELLCSVTYEVKDESEENP
jgi:hypothetical protein